MNGVQVRRLAHKWSQAELAERAGISRTAISAIEGEKLTPSVSSAMALAAALECSVEELFGNGRSPSKPSWAWKPRGDFSRFWMAEVNRRPLAYPVEAGFLNQIPHDGIFRNGDDFSCQNGEDVAMASGTLTVATCDPAAGILSSEYASFSGFRMLVFPRGGGTALQLLKDGLVHVAAVHRSTKDHPNRNVDIVKEKLGRDYCMVRAAQWESGVAVSASVAVHSANALLRRRWAYREPGSAARECLDEIFGGHAFDGRQVDNHFGVAEAVRIGWADAGICVKLCAVDAGLNFLPLRTETLDFCFSKDLENDPRIMALIGLLRSYKCRRVINELPGYDTAEMGEMQRL